LFQKHRSIEVNELQQALSDVALNDQVEQAVRQDKPWTALEEWMKDTIDQKVDLPF
jgi:hypothetical protein